MLEGCEVYQKNGVWWITDGHRDRPLSTYEIQELQLIGGCE